MRARLVDLVGQVVVLQEYHNDSETMIEARCVDRTHSAVPRAPTSLRDRYIFPLDEGCAVCGFEAFIGGKHIVGVVKEKEVARQVSCSQLFMCS